MNGVACEQSGADASNSNANNSFFIFPLGVMQSIRAMENRLSFSRIPNMVLG
jgi:hypothetical protein